MASMKLIVWLGNPWNEYANTRHNVGFMMVEWLREAFDFPLWKKSRFQWDMSEWIFNNQKIILFEPTTFMNLSGIALTEIMKFYRIPIPDILVLSDDLDMEFAKVRYRSSGSSGWQRGIDSIITSLGRNDFTRIKIGIGRDEKYTVTDWVLSRFSLREKEILEKEVFPIVKERVEIWIDGKNLDLRT